MKIIIAGGGTGGHLYPGIAVAEEFLNRSRESGVRGQESKDRIQKTDIVFIGTEHGIEARVIPREGYPIRFLKAEGFVGKSLFKKIRALFSFILSIHGSYRILKSVRPDAVIGVGGYASVGMVLTAYLKGIPAIILEQNSVPGFANKFLGKFVDAIALTYQESISFFPKDRAYLTGNPIRRQILQRDEKRSFSLFPIEKGKFTVFVFGGSSGARSINSSILEALNYLLDLRQNIQFLHQTGETDYEKVKNAYRRLGFNGIVVPFIYQMAEAYTVADIVVCRAGATTLSEITAIGKPAILIPFPHAASNHQEFNARKLEDMGAARMILDRELKGEVLADAIRELYADEKARKEMQKAAAAFGRMDAAERIVDLAMSLMKK